VRVCSCRELPLTRPRSRQGKSRIGSLVAIPGARRGRWAPDPPPAATAPAPPEALEMSLRGASDAKAERELGWQPRYASWRHGFAASLA